MLTKVKTNNDIVYQLDIYINKNTEKVRVKDFNYFEVKFFTTNSDNSIVCSYTSIGEIYDGIIEQVDADFAILNASQLQQLENGLLKYEIHFQLASGEFDDNFYDYSEFRDTDIYLQTLNLGLNECKECQ